MPTVAVGFTSRMSGVSPRVLGLEITESVLIDDAPRVSELLGKIRALGIHLSLDDFGTGHSSLGYLKRFPVETLKVDRSFVRDIPGDHNDCVLVEAIRAISRRFDMQVVAEGVENQAQAAWLTARGCEFAQGYLYGKPTPEDAFRALLSSGLPEGI